jgi:lipoyl(octanoyl) transferase
MRMEALVAQVRAGAPEQIILSEHEPILTLGSSAKDMDIGTGHAVPHVATSRGGQVTYHGPGQRVIYPIVRLDARWGGNTGGDIRVYMRRLQQWLAATCAELGVATELRTGTELGLWVQGAKLAAFGVKISKGVAYHGAAINISNDLDIYQKFTPCGLTNVKTTRLTNHLPTLTMAQFDAALVAHIGVFLQG